MADKGNGCLENDGKLSDKQNAGHPQRQRKKAVTKNAGEQRDEEEGMKNKRAAGADYEQKAAKYLEAMGYRILAYNFRCRMGEIDLIARDGRYLVFIEVKYRTDTRMGMPQEAVDYRKQRKICQVADYYCLTKKIPPSQPCRFDVAAFSEGKWTILRNAFDYLL